ncbi:MAG TPA: hypothetical protein VGC06_27765 [Actinomycetes bacterium]
MVDDAGESREQQQRQLEEIRRSFQEIGVRVGAFEPAQHNGSGNQPPSASVLPAGPRLVMRWPLAVVAAVAVVCLLLGGGLGYLLHRPTAAAEVPAAAEMPATSIVTRVVPSPPQTRVVVPPACLETARRADELMDLFTRKVRDHRLSLALKEYTLASQACRKEASS